MAAAPDNGHHPVNQGSEALPADPAIAGLDVYIVGGAVRDALLGIPAGDRDWVVVGASPQAMIKRGFIPVGGDFPVFLHPRTKEEYALARTERKSGRGYKGFTFYTGPDVTLEDDLRRRDLTVNAIARTPEGHLVDPMDGKSDLDQRILRHVGQAFTEDPVRLLRLARFAARFPDFSVAEETMDLARHLVANGEVDALVPERVWQELAKGLMAAQPGRMLSILEQTGALACILPGFRHDKAIARELACAGQLGLDMASRFALMCRHCDDPVQVGRHVRAPTACQDSARLLPEVLLALKATGASGLPDHEPAPLSVTSAQLPDHDALDLMLRCDALRKPDRFMNLLRAAGCALPVDTAVWQQRVDAVRGVDAGAVAQAAGGQPHAIKQALWEARLAALAELDLP